MHTHTKTFTRLTRTISAFCAVWLATWVALGGISIEHVSAASSWSPTLIVNTEAFQSIDDSDTSANIVLRFGETINKTLTYNRSLARFQFDDDLYISGGLDVTGTVSGATLYGTKSLRSSGSLVFEGAASGSSLYLGNSLQGAGLADCDADGQTLAWDVSTGRFSCGDDDSGGSITLQNAYDNDVDGSDTTITQGLADDSIVISNPAALGTNSAFMLQLDQNATVVGEAIAIDIDSESTGVPAMRIDIAGDSDSPHLSFGQGGTFDTNLYRSTTNTLRTDDSLIVDTNVGIGTTDLSERLEVQGTASGTTVYGNSAVRSSGALVWEGAASGNTLFVSGNASFTEDLTFGDAINDAITVNAAAWTFANDTNFVLSGGVNALSFDTSTFSVDATADRIGIGTIAPDTTLEVVGTISGSVVYGNGSLRSSGSLVWEGAGSGASLYIGGSLQGVGLTNCDNATTSKLLWNSATGRFSCGTDTDTNTTYTAGQGLNLNSTSLSLGSNISGTLLEFTTVSGSTTFGNNSVRSSGALVWEGAASGNTLFVSGNASFAEDLTFGDAIADAITVNAGSWTFANATNFAVTNAANAFSIDTDTFSVDALNNRIGIRTTAPDNPLEVVGTISGSVVYGNSSLRSSGSLVWEGPGSGASLYIGGSLQGVGLTDCDTGATSKLLWDASTGRFSCGTDQTGGAGSPEVGTASFSGGVVRVSDGRYVNTSGDTMTGVLTVQNGNTHVATATPLINTRGTMSGVTVYANSQLSSSGSLAVEGTTAFRGVQYTWPGAAASSSGKVLKVNPANGQLSWSDDSTGGGGGPSTVVSTANVSDSTTGGTNNVTGLTIPVSASTNYIIRCLLTTNAATTTTGVQITVNGPAAPSQITWQRQSCSSTTALVNANINAFGTEDARTASAGATRCIEPINIHLRNNGTAGNVTFSVDTEIASSAVTVYQGSFCDYQSY